MSEKIPTVGVVVPSNRPESLAAWEKAWAPHLQPHATYLPYYFPVHDEPETWDAIWKDLKSDAWIIPIRTDAIRSYGYLQAYRFGCDYIVTVDDDCLPLPDENPVQAHLAWLQTIIEPDTWVRTIRSLPTRGLPLTRPIILNHGLWTGIPDVTAERQLQGIEPGFYPDYEDTQIIPTGKYFPMSGMNLAWRRSLTPWMYFGLSGHKIMDPDESWGYHRIGDILCGVVVKTMIDKLGLGAVRSGTPYVHHQRASDPYKNLELEKESLDIPRDWATRMAAYGATSNASFAALEHHNYPSEAYCRSYVKAYRTWQRLTA